MPAKFAALSGRKELLQWLNGLCDAEYPAVESLRDGAAYCTIVEAAVSRIAQNCVATQSSEAPIARSRADQARKYLEKLDWSATPAVCENADPAFDSVSLREVCFQNMRLLQSMLQECVPAEHRTTVDTKRLALGKLQDHVALMRWIFSFMSKVLAQYSKKALEKKAGVVIGSVEGVKLNRTARLRSCRASSSAGQESKVLSQPREGKIDLMGEQVTGTPRLLHTERSPPRTSLRARTHYDRLASARSSNSPFRTPISFNSGPAPAHASSGGGLPGADARVSSSLHRTAPASVLSKCHASASAKEGPRERTIHSHYTRGTMAVPDFFCTTLVGLRNEVEELERQVLCAQECHNYHLTHRTSEGEGDRVLSLMEAKYGLQGKVYHEGRETLSLEELGELLEKRDRLAQQYVSVDAVVTQALQSARLQGSSMSPLLRDLLELLHPT